MPKGAEGGGLKMEGSNDPARIGMENMKRAARKVSHLVWTSRISHFFNMSLCCTRIVQEGGGCAC